MGIVAPFTIIKWIIIFVTMKNPRLAMNLLVGGIFIVGIVISIFSLISAFGNFTEGKKPEMQKPERSKIDYSRQFKSPSGKYYFYGEKFKDARGIYISLGESYVDENGNTYYYGVDDNFKRD